MVSHPAPSCLLPTITLHTIHYEARGGGSKWCGLSDKGREKDRSEGKEKNIIVREGLMEGGVISIIAFRCGTSEHE